MDFRLDFSLQRSALISWSGWFWNRTDIKDKMKGIIFNVDLKNLHHRERIRDLVNVAKGYLKAVNMPRLLYDRLVEVIMLLGLRAINWYSSTSREYRSIPFEYATPLYWTVLGAVDEAKIVKNICFEKLKTLQNEKQMCDIYYMACASIMKDFINSNAYKMLGHAESWMSKGANNEKWKFIACSVLTIASPEQVSEEKEIELISKYFPTLNDRKEAYMFCVSVKKGQFIAARYYWQRLNSSEREEKIIEAAGICLRSIHLYSRPSTFMDILFFLLMEVLEKGMKQFFLTEYKKLQILEFPIKILNSLIRSYGWESNFFSVFDLLRSEITKHREYYSLLGCIIDTLHEKRMIGLDSKNTIYHQILSVVLSDNGFELDRNPDSNSNSEIVKKVFELFDLDVINIMLEKYSGYRIDILKKGEIQYAKLIRDKKFNLLRDFMVSVLKSEDDLEWFRSWQIDTLYTLIREDAFYLADNLLNVLGSSEEERKGMKHRMDFLSLTAEFFIKSEYTFAEKILNWGFSDDKEKTEYFNTFKGPKSLDWWLENAPRSHFLIIFWRKHIDRNHLILSLSEFLNWFFKRENANYKISNIFSETLLRIVFEEIYEIEIMGGAKCFFLRKAFKKIDELMKLCVPLEDIAMLKSEITKKTCEWLTECVFLGRRFRCRGGKCWGFLDSFLDWILECSAESFNYEKKREFVKSLLHSRDGLMLFKLIVSSFFVAKDYLCSWIEWAGGIQKIEHLLYEMKLLPENFCRSFQVNFQCLKQMFEQFERGISPSKTLEHTCIFRF